MENISDRVKRTQEKYSKGKADPDMKICPFSTSAAGVVYCTPHCALYRPGKQKGYECPFTELTSMSWFIKGQPHKGK